MPKEIKVFQSHPRTTAPCYDRTRLPATRAEQVSISSENHCPLLLRNKRLVRSSTEGFNLIREPLPLATIHKASMCASLLMFQSHPRTTAPCYFPADQPLRRMRSRFNLIREPLPLATQLKERIAELEQGFNLIREPLPLATL